MFSHTSSDSGSHYAPMQVRYGKILNNSFNRWNCRLIEFLSTINQLLQLVLPFPLRLVVGTAMRMPGEATRLRGRRHHYLVKAPLRHQCLLKLVVLQLHPTENYLTHPSNNKQASVPSSKVLIMQSKTLIYKIYNCLNP